MKRLIYCNGTTTNLDGKFSIFINQVDLMEMINKLNSALEKKFNGGWINIDEVCENENIEN